MTRNDYYRLARKYSNRMIRLNAESLRLNPDSVEYTNNRRHHAIACRLYRQYTRRADQA